jgi:ATP-dependent RNA helicase RhlE
MIIDDAELIVKQGLQLPVVELANSIGKAQHLVFTTVLHDKLNKMLAPFMSQPALVEVEELGDAEYDTYEQLLYHVPNFGTKLNLLNLFLKDAELFTKTVVLVNTRPTAEKIYQSLKNSLNNAVAVYKPWFFEMSGFTELNEFKASAASRILILVNEPSVEIDLHDIPFLIHFELPAEKELFINRVINTVGEHAETLAITFITDLELDVLRKIEQQTGQKIAVAELPGDLLIEKERKSSGKAKPKTGKEEIITGEAFHEKKPSNAKNYNYGAGVKAKMTNKKKHS